MSTYAIKQRKYIMHSAHPTVGVSIASFARGFPAAVAKTAKVQVVIDPKDQALATRLQNYIADTLGDHFSIDWDCLAIKAKGMSLESISSNHSDCMVLFGHPAEMNTKALHLIYDYWQRGGSIVGIRIADFALQGTPKFANDIFAGEYQYEHFLARAKINSSPQAKKHPLLSGVQPFIAPGGIHRYDLMPTEATPILFASVAGGLVPVAWVRSRLGRKVFATSLGSASDFRHPCFLRLLANAIIWTSR